MNTAQPVPLDVVQEVERYVESQLADAVKYSNRSPLDDSGVYDLHTLVARVYAGGFREGEVVADEKARRRASRAERAANPVDA